MSTPVATALDLPALKRAIEQRDAAAQVALYAPDAEATIVDRITTPAPPPVLHGGAEVAGWAEGVCSRDMTHRVEHEVLADGRAAFSESCRYPDGTNVLCMTVLELAGGRIVRPLASHARDGRA